MATKEQYEFFRFLHEDEERTYLALEARGRFYFSVISLFFASLLLKAEVITSATTLGIPRWVLTVFAAVLTLSLVLVTVAARIRSYEGVADPKKIVESYGKKEPKDEAFFDDRIADLVVATNRNSVVNERVATVLFWAGVCLAFAMILALVSLVFFAR